MRITAAVAILLMLAGCSGGIMTISDAIDAASATDPKPPAKKPKPGAP